MIAVISVRKLQVNFQKKDSVFNRIHKFIKQTGMGKKSISLILLILLVSFTLHFNLMGNELELIRGQVKIRSKKTDLVYRKKGQRIPVFHGDRIQTGPRSKVKIFLKEQGDTIELQSFSFFKLAVGEENLDKMVLPVGKARFKVKKRVGLRNRFKVRTGNAIVGVKGTEWVMSSGEGDTSVLTIEGTVSLANILAPEISVNVTQNRASRIEQNKLPTTPVEVPPLVREQVTKSDSRKAFSTITYGEPITPTKEQLQNLQKREKKEEKEGAEGQQSGEGEEKEGLSANSELLIDTGLDEEEVMDFVIDDPIDEIDDPSEPTTGPEIETIEIKIDH